MRYSKGFTLIELMIVIAIIGVLASIAIPQYKTFAERSQFTNVALAIGSVKSAMEICIQIKQNISDCNTANKIGINLAKSAQDDYVNSITINTLNGGITAIGNDTNSSTFILTPNLNGTWVRSGTCIANGVC
jgi:type IV pilus assembly protein PilA